MKIILALTLFIAFWEIAQSQSPAAVEDISKDFKACLDENKTIMQDFVDFDTGKLKPADVKDNMKCAMKCIYEKSGFMDAAAVLKPDVMKAKFGDSVPAAKFEKVMTACKDLKGTNACDTAFLIAACIGKNDVMLKN